MALCCAKLLLFEYHYCLNGSRVRHTGGDTIWYTQSNHGFGIEPMIRKEGQGALGVERQKKSYYYYILDVSFSYETMQLR